MTLDGQTQITKMLDGDGKPLCITEEIMKVEISCTEPGCPAAPATAHARPTPHTRWRRRRTGRAPEARCHFKIHIQ